MLAIIINICSNYQPYLDILPVEALPDQSLFWSRTSSLVDILSMMNAMVTVVSSANTPSSKVITDIAKRMNISQLNWCGSVDGKNGRGKKDSVA